VQQRSKIAAAALFLLGPWLFRQRTIISIIAERFSMGLRSAQEEKAETERERKKERQRERRKRRKKKALGYCA